MSEASAIRDPYAAAHRLGALLNVLCRQLVPVAMGPCFRRDDTESFYTSSVTVTGTWSDGRGQPRASREILKSLMPSLRARDTQM